MSESQSGPRYLAAPDVQEGLTMGVAIAAVRDALIAATHDEFEQPPRLVLDDGRLLVMVAVSRTTGDTVVKTVRIKLEHGGAAPAITGTAMWLDGASHRTTLIADATELTAIRTGAVSGLATDLLADPGASRLTVIGSGRQAGTQVEAVCTVRPIEQVSVVSRTPSHALNFAERLRKRRPQLDVSVVDDADRAVATADVLCCATSAQRPLFRTASLPEHVHVNAVGSYRASMCEIPADLLATASVVAVDDIAGCFEESGEIIEAVAAGLSQDRVEALGALARTSNQDGSSTRPGGRTVFKSVGCAALDWAVVAALSPAYRHGQPAPELVER